MAGRATAVINGAGLRARVVLLAQRLGLEARTEVRVAGRIRSAERGIDVVLTRLDTGQLRLVGLWLQVRVH